MRHLSRLWKTFRSWPQVVQLFAILAVLGLLWWMIPGAKADEEEGTFTVQAQGLCQDGKLVGIRLFMPIPGYVTVPIPENACKGAQPAQKTPARQV